MVTVRPIKKGDQLFEPRIPIRTEPTQKLKQLDEHCVCSRCRGIMATSAERQQLSSEPLNRSLGDKWLNGKLFKSEGSDKVKDVTEDYAMLLRKYGHIEWCEEINSVLVLYQGALYVRVIGSVQ